MISGYLITRNIVYDKKHERFTFRHFYAARIRRLWPALAATLFITFIFGALILSPENFENLSTSTIAALFSVSNFLFWQDVGYFALAAEVKPLLHTWSLGVEEQFYLIWPPFVALLLARMRSWISAAILLFIIIFGTFVSQFYLSVDWAAVFYLMPFRIAEFALGAILVFLRPQLPKIISHFFVVAGLLLIIYSGLNIDRFTEFPGLNSLYPTVGACLLIWGSSNSLLASPLKLSPIVWIGKISYSLYLVHWPLIVYLKYNNPTEWSVQFKLFVILLSFLAASTLYYTIEQKYRYVRQKQASRISLFFLGSAFVAILISGFAASALIGKGWKWRIDETNNSIVSHSQEKHYLNCEPYKDTLSRYITCSHNNKAEKSVTIIGDSYATALYNGYFNLADEKNLRVNVIAINGQLPLWGVRTYLNQRKVIPLDNEGNPTNFSKAHRSEEGAGSDLVVIHARWELVWNRTRPEPEGRSSAYLVRWNRESENRSQAKSQDQFRAAVRNTFDRFYQDNNNVVLLGAIPHVGSNMAQCLDSPTILFSSETLIKRCRYLTRQEAIARAGEVNAVLRDILQDYPHIRFVDPVNAFCGNEAEDYCKVTEDGHLLYSDTNHLSPYGAKYLIETYSRELLP